MIERVGIIGGGKMGKDIFYFLSDFPFNLKWVIRSKSGFESANEAWNKKLRRRQSAILSKDSKITSFKKEIILTQDMASLEDCDMIIESITEDQEIKSGLFKKLDQIVNSKILFASNTSSIPIRSFVPSERRIDRFIGMHFFYPLKFKNFVEVNILPETTEATLVLVKRFLSKTGKSFKVLPVPHHFLFNRLFLKLQAGACRLHIEEQIPVNEIDALIRENLFPIGIFEFFDKVGIDVMYTAVKNYSLGSVDIEFYKPLIESLKKLKAKKQLGVKTGKGYYNYDSCDFTKSNKGKNKLNKTKQQDILQKFYSWYLSPLFEAVSLQILEEEEALKIVNEYMGIEKSPFDLAKEIGFNHKII
jgi:3-hydroxybutyryl-CoA dehydrogenase